VEQKFESVIVEQMSNVAAHSCEKIIATSAIWKTCASEEKGTV
jgi:hypothetical protein